MMNTPPIHQETISTSSEVSADVLFVDLDETILDGTVIEMSDEELINADLIQVTLNRIQNAKNAGIPVVMVSRNKTPVIDRFFTAKPELRLLFDDIMPCLGEKSHLINCYLTSHGIAPENTVFIDDNPTEIADVSSLGVKTYLPQNAGHINLVKSVITKEKIVDINRYKIGKDLDPAYTDDIALAA